MLNNSFIVNMLQVNMRTKSTLLLIAWLFISILHGFTQSNIHYYGWNSQYSHYPTDIIQTQDGGFLITGDVNSSQPLFENYIFKQYLVHTNSNGDTLWTRYYDHEAYGGANTIQTPAYDFISFGAISGGYMCGMTGTSIPFFDYCLQTFSSTGDSLSTNQFNDTCDDRFQDFIKNTGGGITALMVFSDLSGNYTYSIKELSPGGIITTIPVITNYMLEIEKADNGYWIASHNKLYKVSFSGNPMWQKSMTFIPYIADFCKVNNDSLVFVYSSTDLAYGDTVHVVKTDSFGNPAWNKKYYLRAADIMLHSSGNYVLTGRQDSNLVVLALNTNGDSLWGKTYSLTMSAFAVKTIETNNNAIAILAYSVGFGLPGQYVLILDTIDSTTTIRKNNFQQTIEVFPNPVQNVLHIKISGSLFRKNFKIKIYNSFGQQVKDLFISDSFTEISLKEFRSGIYYYNIILGDKIISHGKITHDN